MHPIIPYDYMNAMRNVTSRQTILNSEQHRRYDLEQETKLVQLSLGPTLDAEFAFRQHAAQIPITVSKIAGDHSSIHNAQQTGSFLLYGIMVITLMSIITITLSIGLAWVDEKRKYYDYVSLVKTFKFYEMYRRSNDDEQIYCDVELGNMSDE